jgi:hypothetical protein
MSKHVFLMDITRHKGPMQNLISSARAHADRYSPESVIWFHHPSQIVGQLSLNEQVEAVPNELSAAAIVEKIRSLSSNGSANSTFHVMSYDIGTLTSAIELNSPELVVTSKNLASIKREFKPSRIIPAASLVPKVNKGSMPVDEAIVLTKALLLKYGHTSEATPLLQLHLRNLLSARDPRALRNRANPRSVSLIKEVVEAGLEQGWLRRKLLNGRSGTEAIWLAEPVPTLVKSTLEVVVTPIRSAAAQKAEDRTQSIVQALKDRGFYSPKDVRDLVLGELRKAVDGSNSLTVNQVFRKASLAAQQVAADNGKTFSHWHPAVDSILRTTLAAGVLIGVDLKPIPSGFASRGFAVGSVSENVIDECDAFLLAETIRSIPTLTERDATSIAHAIFKQAPSEVDRDEMIDRVYEMLAKLGNRIEEAKDGTLSVAF